MEFDQHRFDELVLFIAHQTADDPNFGRTKLAKTLFYSDFAAYRDEGESLTGASYIRMPFGPYPQELDDAESRLAAAGRASLKYDVPKAEHKKLIPLSLDHAATLYEGWQLETVKVIVRDLTPQLSRAISDDSHEHPGWVLARSVGRPIPYASAYTPNQPPPDEAVELGRRLADEHQWA